MFEDESKNGAGAQLKARPAHKLPTLREHLAASGADRLAASQSILPHTGQHNSQTMRPVQTCNRAQERIGRRPAGILRQVLVNLGDNAGSLAGNSQMVVSRCDPCPARLEQHS